MPHYVYRYRDERGQPRYAGYGELVTRAVAHLIKSHNANLIAALDQRELERAQDGVAHAGCGQTYDHEGLEEGHGEKMRTRRNSFSGANDAFQPVGA